MVKIRLEGLPHEVKATLAVMREIYVVRSVSKPYPNRNSDYVRIYVEIEAPILME